MPALHVTGLETPSRCPVLRRVPVLEAARWLDLGRLFLVRPVAGVQAATL